MLSFRISALLLATLSIAGQAYADGPAAPYETLLTRYLELQESIGELGAQEHPCGADSMNNIYLKKLAANPTSVMTDYLQTWSGKTPKAGNPWRHCYDPEHDNEPVASDGHGYVKAECTPDTLYSWGAADKIADLEKTLGAGKWPGPGEGIHTIYTVGTPTGSFAYGDTAVRIKLKPGTKFKVTNTYDCGQLSRAEKKNTVLARVFNNGAVIALEYDICSATPIESWSFGTRHQYDEMVSDVKFILDPANQNSNSVHQGDFQTYMEYLSQAPKYFGSGVDGHFFGKEELVADLKKALQMSDAGEGRAFVNPDSRSEDPAADVRRHFESKTQSYFHSEPNGESNVELSE